ncbi:MAG: hypothetical protein H6672_12485 [Anaerolineaceae bacterium]|nr:hypothetical protein [Anaerolineaceae bacterium]
MPLLTRWVIRTALLYLIAGVLTGALYWANTLWQLWPPLRAFNPVYIHLLVVGWITQLIFGVMYWMFPIISKTNMRGSPYLAWGTYVLLNMGLLLRAVGEPWRTLDPTPINQALLVLSALIQVAAGILLILTVWPRVRERAGR